MPYPSAARYVVLEWPSGTASPEVADTTLFTSLYDADDTARDLRKAAADRGRPAIYTVHAVSMEAEEL
jgi:hypothetical protein